MKKGAALCFRSRAVRIAGIYALLATLWIYFSDHALKVLLPDPESVIKWSVYKGVAFVGFTTTLLLLLLTHAFRAIEAGYGSLRRKTRQLRESEEQLATVIGTAMDAIVTADPTNRIVLFNGAAEKMFGCAAEEARGQPLSGFLASIPEDRETQFITEGIRQNGERFPMEASLSRGESGDRKFVTIILRDVSLRQAHEAEIERFNRLFSARNQINAAIVRVETRDALFRRVCQVLVEFGEFQMAWVGWHDHEAAEVKPAAAAGDENGYLQAVKVHTGGEPGHRGPTGRAFDEGRPYISNDTLDDPALLPWRDEVRRRGFRAAAFFPIRLKSAVCGVLNVYADAPGFFQDKEISLLGEVAVDISYALDNLARREARQRAEAVARRERHFSQAMIESMPGILYFYNQDGQFLRWNKNLEKVTGYSGEEIARMHALDFVTGEHKRRVKERIAEVFETGESAVEASLVSKDGTGRPYFLTGRRIEFDGMACLVGVGIDISDRKRMEIELRELNHTLEHQVAERTAELQTALIRAQAADRMKSSFLATMSHELRTPLNSIIGFTGIVLQGLAGELNAEQTKQLKMVQNSARHLLDLINDVLDLSKIEAGQLEIRAESFDLAASVEQVMLLVQPLAEKKGLTLRKEVAPDVGTMVSDRRRVEQILLNLLNNAIKFTDDGGVTLTIETVAVYRASPDDAPCPAVCIRINDTGIGIEPEDLATLFQPFRQIDSSLTRHYEGTGLGLAICRRLAALLRGEIHATSKSSKGSEFIVTLPMNLSHHDEPLRTSH